MVRTIDDAKQKDRFVERLFLISLKKWCPEGVECTVSNIGKVFEDKTHKQKVRIKDDKGKTKEITLPKTKMPVKISVLGNMPHIRANKIDENGQYIMIEDEFEGTKTPEAETIDNPKDVEVTFFHNMGISGAGYDETKDLQEQEFVINNKSKLWPLLNFGFIKHGDIPEGNTKSIACFPDEIVEVLTDLKFIATMDSWKIPGGKPYPVLIPLPSKEYDDDVVVAEPVEPTPKHEPKREDTRKLDVEDFDDLNKIPQAHLGYMSKKNPYIKEAIHVLDSGNVPLTSQKLMQELSFMQSDGTMTNDEYHAAKDLVFQTLA